MSKMEFKIGKRKVGRGHPVLIIGEVAQAHDGDFRKALKFIDAAAAAGADAVKFQTHIAAAETTPHEPWRVKFSRKDATRYDYWKRMEFSEKQWRQLKKRADKRGILFLSSPFSPEAVEILKRVGVPAWKVASGEVSNLALIERMAKTRRPVLLSSGMSGWGELDRAVKCVRAKKAPLLVFQCTTAYPCPPEKTGLNVLSALRKRYRCPAGFSDHSGTIYAGLAAAALGADAIEVHVMFGDDTSGPDAPASLTFEKLGELVQGVRFVEQARGGIVNKDREARQLLPLRKIFTKSVVVRGALSAGTVLRSKHLAAKKPGTGIPAARLEDVIGRRLKHDVEADHLLKKSDLEPEGR